jgi:hypothetical protein
VPQQDEPDEGPLAPHELTNAGRGEPATVLGADEPRTSDDGQRPGILARRQAQPLDVPRGVLGLGDRLEQRSDLLYEVVDHPPTIAEWLRWYDVRDVVPLDHVAESIDGAVATSQDRGDALDDHDEASYRPQITRL